MSKTSRSASFGIGFVGLLAIVFITLKLVGKITWSWLWVLSPLWEILVIFVAIVIALAIIGHKKD